ncbi:type VI secretion system lipoprotein TssJ [Dickeya chrysanthemi]|uniref:type VI secretion system lipoprotein TssJ n=1 Tax=Dickeya chrysanthemi TaxID=556 RepID=UPI0025A12DBB|nr:type VI secretion system lipoprotein TssJ [Dickeya chrysanthemi]WJM83693.1 type VI secretion system lipoprotein TssJ [Dickeya chrysanthemi]
MLRALMLRTGWLCVLMLLLPGCSTLGKMAKVAANPDIQIGSNDNQPSTIGFSLLAEPDVNPSESGDAAPIEFQLVMLAEDSRLLATDYDQVTGDIEKALAKNYLSHQDYTLLPGQFKYLPPVKLDEKVHYIGVIAKYADPDSAEWRKVVKLKNTGRTYQLLVHLRREEVEIKKDQEEE